MKFTSLLLILTFYVSSYGQSNLSGNVVLRRTQYINGNSYRQTLDTIKSNNGIIDALFLKHHSGILYHLPETIVDKSHKNQTITIRNDDKYIGSTKSFAYDSLSRLVNFSNSGCPACSDLPYNYKITYNVIGKIETITNNGFGIYSYKFQYDEKANLRELNCYTDTVLTEKVELIAQ